MMRRKMGKVLSQRREGVMEGRARSERRSRRGPESGAGAGMRVRRGGRRRRRDEEWGENRRARREREIMVRRFVMGGGGTMIFEAVSSFRW